jgi:hypothetical protein
MYLSVTYAEATVSLDSFNRLSDSPGTSPS